MLGAAGVTEIETSVPVPIVRVVLPVMPDAVAEMVTVPLLFPCAMPEDRIDAKFVRDDFHDTPLRLVATLPSLKVPVAVNLIKVPALMRGFVGVTAIKTRCAVETVRPVDPVMLPKAAVMVVLPAAPLVAKPCALIVAAAGIEEVQTTLDVMFWVDESLYVPVAVNCLVVPTAMLELAGVTTIETNVAPVTVSEAVPLIDPEVAVMVAVPVPTPDTRPLEFTEPTEFEEELQVMACNNCVLPSSKLPVAVN